jgi:hypothetical protein
MTTDRTALEAARDALPPLPVWGQTDATERFWDILSQWERAAAGSKAAISAAERTERHVEKMLRDYAAQAVTAALSSPPVLPALVKALQDLLTLCAERDPGQGDPERDHPAVTAASDALYAYEVANLPSAAAPQASAPALDDARDADTKRLDWVLPNLHPATFGMEFPGGYQWADDAEYLSKWRAAIDAELQQEPRS